MFQMIRSGQFGRTSLSSSLQRAFQRWLNTASVGKLLSASIGHDPSLRDVLRMARPTPKDNERRALFGWLTDKETEKWAPATEADLPAQVQTLMAFRQADNAETQALIARDLSVRWDLLADAAKGPLVWKAIARQMGPQALRMNLNTLLRHEVLGDGKAEREMVDYVASRLADADEIARSRQFPYQFLAAYLNAAAEVPQKIKAALQQAAEFACGNVPELPGPVVIGLDTSGSMNCPVTGFRGRGGVTKMRCVERGGAVRGGDLPPQPGQRRGSVRHPGVRRPHGSVRFDPESVGAAGEVRRRRHRLLAPAAPSQHEASRAEVRGRGAGERQPELGVPQPGAGLRSARRDGRVVRVANVRREPAAVGRPLAEADLHRPPAVWFDAGARA